MSSSILIPVHVPQLGDQRRRHWAKLVTAVDAAKSSGWAFVGEFVADGGIQDLPVGGVLLLYGERGGQSNPRAEAHLYRIGVDATLTLEASTSGRAWARTLRDRAAELLDEEFDQTPDLSQIPDQTLADELTSRGWRVER